MGVPTVADTFCLKQVASLQLGVSFREKLEFTPDGNALVVQMRDLDDGVLSMSGALMRIGLHGIVSQDHDLPDNPDKPDRAVRTGDLVLRTRGDVPKVTRLEFPANDPVIVAAPLILIRAIDKQWLLPEYLQWYLNHPATTSELCSRMGMAKALNRRMLDDLPVRIPDVERQRELLALAAAVAREAALLRGIAEKHERLINTELMLGLGGGV